MAINKKLIHFKLKSTFDSELEQGNILDTSIVFIQDANLIWTHGTYYCLPNDEVIITDGIEPEDGQEIWIDTSEDSTLYAIEEAPKDGKLYSRQNGKWVEVSFDTSNLATKEEVTQSLATKLDISTYNIDKETFETKTNAAATYQPKGDYLTSVPSEYITESELEGKGYALKSEIPSAYTLPKATSGALGGVKIGYPESGKNYPVELNSSGQAYVNVPWTDTDTIYSNATTSSSGLMTAADKTLLDRYSSYQTISSLSNIAATKSILFLSTSSNQSLSISSFPTNVSAISIFIYNSGSSTLTITIPSTGSYVAMNGTSLSISGTSGKDWGEISIVYVNNKYLIRIGEVE